MVAQLLGLKQIPKPADAADALAIAICQGFRGVSTSTSYTKAQVKWNEATKSASAKSKR
jgi:crossover junction endodeoxyribonuclease RuvC